MLIFAPPGGSNLQSVYVTRNDYAIVFLWQFPHFMAIAWMYRVDYDRAGYDVLPACEAGRSVMVWQIVAPLLLLLPLSVTMPVLVGRAGPWYLATAIVSAPGSHGGRSNWSSSDRTRWLAGCSRRSSTCRSCSPA